MDMTANARNALEVVLLRLNRVSSYDILINEKSVSYIFSVRHTKNN